MQTLPLGTSALATDLPNATTTPSLPGTFANRAAESAVLHTKGGWRDHSDGNRITTTRGDKVEVIRGNYKMVILGRQELNPLKGSSDFGIEDWATGLDESGGLSDNQDQAHGVNGVLAIAYNWEPASDGRWGWTQRTTTGAHYAFPVGVDPAPPGAPGSDVEQTRASPGNGRQITTTWIDELQTFMGGPPPGDAAYSPPPPPPPVSPTGVDALGN
jgi:hypothetical protein